MTDREPAGDWPPRSGDFEQDLEPGLEREERERLLALAARLIQNRPVPRPGLRSAIRSSLLGGHSPRASARIAAMIFGYATSGALLLVVAAAGLIGIGPFAA